MRGHNGKPVRWAISKIGAPGVLEQVDIAALLTIDCWSVIDQQPRAVGAVLAGDGGDEGGFLGWGDCTQRDATGLDVA